MSPSTTRRWPQLSHLLLASGCVSATLTLTNFEDISSKVAVKGCISAYGSPLTNCGIDDFTDGNACSSKCKSSIAEVQSTIQSECGGVSVDSNSLLYRAQKGQLQAVICLSGSDDDDEEEPATTTVSKSNQNQMIQTSQTKTSTTAVTMQTTMSAQTTSLVLAGDEPTASAASKSDATSTAKATETTKASSRGGDPFASNDTGSGASVRVGYASLVISAVACMMAVVI